MIVCVTVKIAAKTKNRGADRVPIRVTLHACEGYNRAVLKHPPSSLSVSS